MIDFPGFGNSSGRTIQTRNWKGECHDIMKGVLEAMDVKGPVSIIAVCGGAATTFRTLPKYPHLFAKRHVFHNCVISEWPVEMEEVMKKKAIKCMITWCEDPDHSKMCVSYKRLTLLKRQGFPNIDFSDIDNVSLFRPNIVLKNTMTKCQKKRVSVFLPTWSHIQRVIKFMFDIEIPDQVEDEDSSEFESTISTLMSCDDESVIDEEDRDDTISHD
jgi:hypothetical protein